MIILLAPRTSQAPQIEVEKLPNLKKIQLSVDEWPGCDGMGSSVTMSMDEARQLRDELSRLLE